MKKSTRTPVVVDCHAVLGQGKTWAEPARAVDTRVDDLFRRGTEAGIDRHCIVAPRNDTYGEANRAVARICEQHPNKLIGFAAHHPQREAGRLRSMLSEEIRSMGLRAVRSDGHPTRELLDAALELDIPVIYLPVPPSGQSISRFYHMPASAYPKVNFILPHLGQFRSLDWTAHMDALDLLRRYANIYADTSGVGSFKYLEMAARESPSRLLFGTCAPELDPRVEMQALRLLKLTPGEHAQAAGARVLRLLRSS
jgi:predicted TIM-barrel fold metal-dependent hydrolase